MAKVSVIIPCYNEEKALPIYFKAVDPVIKKIKGFTFNFVLVNDGSKDKTLEIMNDLHAKRDDIVVCSLSRNFGQNNAFAAGLKVCDGDYAILMDSDLQDPVELIPQICEKFAEGYEVVNPHRYDRSTDSFFKRKTAGMFYKFINRLEKREVNPENVNCFRGLCRRAIDLINSLSESDRYIRTEVTFVGFKTTLIDFKRQKRSAGYSKYSVSKLFDHAFDNISTATSTPLYTPIKVGAIASFLTGVAFAAMLTLMILSWCNVEPFKNISNILTPLFIVTSVFLAMSVIIFIIGILGIYLHNVLINTRNRPSYVIDTLKREGDK